MSFRFLTIFVFSSVLSVYVLLSPFLSNLEYATIKQKGVAGCDAKMTYACFLGVTPICFEYVSDCALPSGWVAKEVHRSAFRVE